MRNNHRFSGHNLHLGCFYLIFLALSIGLFGQELQVNWDHIMKAAEAYVANPSSENALQLFNSIPESQIPASYRHEEFEKVSFYIFEKVLVRLYDLVIQADRNAVKAWIRLYAISDGAFSEDLNDGMGDLIQVDPKMFLEELNFYPDKNLKKYIEVGYMVCNGVHLFKLTTAETYETTKEAIKELELRIRALETVIDANLLQLRNDCIESIRRHQAQLEGVTDWQEQVIDWDNIMQAAVAYFEDPSTENALILYEALPKAQVRNRDRKGGFLTVDEYIYDNLHLLSEHVLKGERNAVKVAVRLWTMADGGFAESLSSMLGQLIRIDPKVFLEEINDFPWPHDYGDFKDWLSKGYIVCEGGILNRSQDEVDERAVREELGMRIKALESVTEKGLFELRDICINAINEEFVKIIRKYEASNDFRLARKSPD